MWFILFLFPSYPNLNYKIEPSPTLSIWHYIVSLAKSVESLKLAASVQYCCSLVFGGVFLLQSCFGEGSLAAVHTLFLSCCCWLCYGCCHLLLKGAVTCEEGAVTCEEGTASCEEGTATCGGYRWLFKGAAVHGWGCRCLWRGNAGCQE